MDYDNAIEIEDEEDEVQLVNRRVILEPAIRNVVSALGGVESSTYRLGDECYGCLKDLKKIWRRDDTDDDRTVARIFYEVLVLPNDLIPILLSTAGAGELEDKRAIAAADLICALTWPIDLAEELKELDEELDARADFTQLLRSHLHYKRALLKPGVLQALFSLVIPCLSRDVKADRAQTERDTQIVHLVLYIIRNLAFVKDPAVTGQSSAEANELATMQSRLVQALHDTHVYDLLLTIAANANVDARFNSWNVTVLEILYLLLRGVKADVLAAPPAEQHNQSLKSLLAVEDQQRQNSLRGASSRHSRFGTTIAVSVGNKGSNAAEGSAGQTSNRSMIIHRQRAIKQGAGDVLDLSSGKKTKSSRTKKTDEVSGREDQLSLEARQALREYAVEMLRAGFNPLLTSLLKDIKSERAKIAEKDHLRLLYVTKWFLAFFRLIGQATGKGRVDVSFGVVAEITERGWISWVLKRMREAVEQKPKAWNELQAGLECLTELILLIEAMSLAASMSTADDEAESLSEMAAVLQQQLVYNGEVLEIALESLKAYREGTQALAYLDASVHLGYALLRMLEKMSKGSTGSEMVVRKRAKAKRKKVTSTEEGEGVADVDEEELAEMEAREREQEDDMREALFTFEAFELRFADASVTTTLLAYLARYKEFGAAHEKMKRVVGLLHRQAVRAKAEGLFFRVSTLDLFKGILANTKSLPKDQAYKDLVSMINFILRKFFKAVEQDPFLLIEAFYPKNRGSSGWKAYSSLTPEELAVKTGKVSGPKADNTVADRRFPPDVHVKKGWSWSEQVGIAIKALVEEEHTELVDWTKDILDRVHIIRQQLTEDTDGAPSSDTNAENLDDVASAGEDAQTEDTDEAMEQIRLRSLNGPSEEAREKFKDYLIPYGTYEQADSATKNPQLKLLFRLLNFTVVDEDSDEIEWCVPKDIMPEALLRCANIVGQFLKTPIDLQGKAAKTLLAKQPRRRRRIRSPSPGLSDSDEADEWDALFSGGKGKKNEERERRKADRKARKEAKQAAIAQRKKKEKDVYKSKQFIEDSDDDAGDAAFWERENALRKRMEAAAKSNAPAGMKSTGTKKRKKNAEGAGKGRKKKRGDSSPAVREEDDASASEVQDGDDNDLPASSPTRGSSEVPTTPPSDEDSDAELARPLPAAPRTKPKPRPRPRPIKKPSATTTTSSQISSPASPGNATETQLDTPSETMPTKRNRIVISDDEED